MCEYDQETVSEGMCVWMRKRENRESERESQIYFPTEIREREKRVRENNRGSSSQHDQETVSEGMCVERERKRERDSLAFF